MKICTWNMENLFLMMDKYQGEDLNLISEDHWQSFSTSLNTYNKHIQKTFDAAEVIKDIDADVYLLSEVGGVESIHNFNKYFLDNKYHYFIHQGNSRRGISVAAMVKKKNKDKFKYITNHRIQLNNGKYISRDFGELHLIDKKGKTKKIFITIHLKSKISSDDDFQGLKQRAAEIEALEILIKSLEEKYRCPIVLGGDFNANPTEYELKNLKNKMIDFQDLKKTNPLERCTHVYFTTQRQLNQFDLLWVSQNLKDKIELKESFVYHFKNEYGDDLGVAESFQEKLYYPSDHYPVILKIKD